MIKSVIFDMDGVLIDSVELGLRMRKSALLRYGVDLDQVLDPQGESHRAASTKSLLENVNNHYGICIDHDEFAEIVRDKAREYLEEQGISADKELLVFLDDLRKHNITCAVVSSGLREGVENKLNILGIKQYFSYIVTGSDVKEHKPHPEPYLYAMDIMRLSPNECVVIEDSLTGIQAAKSAGCKVFGFTKYNLSQEPIPGVVINIKDWNEISYSELKHLLAES